MGRTAPRWPVKHGVDATGPRGTATGCAALPLRKQSRWQTAITDAASQRARRAAWATTVSSASRWSFPFREEAKEKRMTGIQPAACHAEGDEPPAPRAPCPGLSGTRDGRSRRTKTRVARVQGAATCGRKREWNGVGSAYKTANGPTQHATGKGCELRTAQRTTELAPGTRNVDRHPCPPPGLRHANDQTPKQQRQATAAACGCSPPNDLHEGTTPPAQAGRYKDKSNYNAHNVYMVFTRWVEENGQRRRRCGGCWGRASRSSDASPPPRPL